MYLKAEQRKKGSLITANPLYFNGWGTRIRTLIDGVRVRCPTVERSPSIGESDDINALHCLM